MVKCSAFLCALRGYFFARKYRIAIGGFHYAGTTRDMGHTVTKHGI